MAQLDLNLLKDIHLPEPISWWPPAVGWYVVSAIILAGLVYLGMRLTKHIARVHVKKVVLTHFKEAEEVQSEHILDYCVQSNQLLKRIMLRYHQRQQVAGLYGDEWVQFLDEKLGKPYFSQEGRKEILLLLPYVKQVDEKMQQKIKQAIPEFNQICIELVKKL